MQKHNDKSKQDTEKGHQQQIDYQFFGNEWTYVQNIFNSTVDLGDKRKSGFLNNGMWEVTKF